MKAVLCETHGTADQLVMAEIATPDIGAHDVIIAVRAVALNFFDTLIIRNRYQYKPDLPFSPGGEVAGTILAMGEKVRGWALGDRVVTYNKWNGCREQVAVPAEDLIAIPDTVSFTDAAAIPITYGTTLHGIIDRAKAQPGETLAVLGASGGVGLAAIEVGKRLGLTIIAAASSPEKLATAKEHGADHLLDYSHQDLKQSLKDLTNGKGVDIIYDAVGGNYTEPALRACAWNGRHLVVGFAAGDIPKPPLNLVLLKGASLVGVFWGRAMEEDLAGQKAHIATVLNWCAEGSFSPRIDHVYKLEETPKAIAAIAARQIKGKAIVAID